MTSMSGLVTVNLIWTTGALFSRCPFLHLFQLLSVWQPTRILKVVPVFLMFRNNDLFIYSYLGLSNERFGDIHFDDFARGDVEAGGQHVVLALLKS